MNLKYQMNETGGGGDAGGDVYLDVIVHLQQDRTGAGQVSVTLLQVLHGAVVELVRVPVVPGQGPRLSCQSSQLAVTSLLLRLVVLLPEVCQLAEQAGQFQLSPPLLW